MDSDRQRTTRHTLQPAYLSKVIPTTAKEKLKTLTEKCKKVNFTEPW